MSESTGTELAVPEHVLNPLSGELVPAAETARVAEALAAMRQMRRSLLEGVHAAEAILRAESERQGTKTLRYGARKIVVNSKSELVWDVEILNELLDAGLPEDRFNDLVTTLVDYKVDARVARQLEGANPEYAAIIERARRRIDKGGSVAVEGA